MINFSILSTNTNERKVGYWSKTSSNSYSFYLSSSSVDFIFENEIFKCKSNDNICKEVE